MHVSELSIVPWYKVFCNLLSPLRIIFLRFIMLSYSSYSIFSTVVYFVILKCQSWAAGVDQVVQCLPSKLEALG
jgi:hypothetical protein